MGLAVKHSAVFSLFYALKKAFFGGKVLKLIVRY